MGILFWLSIGGALVASGIQQADTAGTVAIVVGVIAGLGIWGHLPLDAGPTAGAGCSPMRCTARSTMSAWCCCSGSWSGSCCRRPRRGDRCRRESARFQPEIPAKAWNLHMGNQPLRSIVSVIATLSRQLPHEREGHDDKLAEFVVRFRTGGPVVNVGQVVGDLRQARSLSGLFDAISASAGSGRVCHVWP